MGSQTTTATSVVVVGGGLAGMAAAARLAKAGHEVQLLEATSQLGGGWGAQELDGVLVDRAPSVLGFPAPWRDLFRKSGRPLETELARIGMALDPVGGAHYVFGDGIELTLPSDRGQQYEVMARALDRSTAVRWRDLVDGLDQVWQAVRPLGLEAELHSAGQLDPARKVLRPRQTIAGLARQLAEPHLAAIVNSVAYRLGSLPDQTPAWCAVELSVARTFGRWTITSTRSAPTGSATPEPTSPDTGRSSVLVDALANRLALRKVDVRLESRVTGLLASSGRIQGVVTTDGRRLPAAAVVCTVDPWQTYGELWPAETTRSQRRTVRRWQPALAPKVTHTGSPEHVSTVRETVELTVDGIPKITYVRPTSAGSSSSVHDYMRALPDRSAGIAWQGFGSWLDRPAVRSELAGLFLAGPFSRGGSSPSAVVLSGALASYACHDYLS